MMQLSSPERFKAKRGRKKIHSCHVLVTFAVDVQIKFKRKFSSGVLCLHIDHGSEGPAALANAVGRNERLMIQTYREAYFPCFAVQCTLRVRVYVSSGLTFRYDKPMQGLDDRQYIAEATCDVF